MRPETAAAAKRRVLPELLDDLRRARQAGQTIVFTNGCFDLLHTGHLQLLESAAQHGDRLIVGINGDRSIRELKGEGRPIVPFDQRSLMLGGMQSVDWIVGFEDATPLRLIEAIRPDVLVKGADWEVEEIVGREIVEGSGGRVVTVPLVPDRSTTSLAAKLRAGIADV